MSIISKYIIQSLVYKVQLSVCAHAFNISPECALSAFYTGLMRGFFKFHVCSCSKFSNSVVRRLYNWPITHSADNVVLKNVEQMHA